MKQNGILSKWPKRDLEEVVTTKYKYHSVESTASTDGGPPTPAFASITSMRDGQLPRSELGRWPG